MKVLEGQAGFTLIESLVALMIMSVAVTAAMYASSTASLHSLGLEQRVKATWTAQNNILSMQTWGEAFVGIGAKNWVVEIEHSSSDVPGMGRLMVSVKDEHEHYPLSVLHSVKKVEDESGS